MIEILVMQAADDGNVIGMVLHMVEAVADFSAGLSAPGEIEPTAHKLLFPDLRKRGFDVMKRCRRLLAVQFLKQGLGIKGVHLAGAAVHEQPDDVLCGGRKMRSHRSGCRFSHQAVQGQHAATQARALQHLPSVYQGFHPASLPEVNELVAVEEGMAPGFHVCLA